MLPEQIEIKDEDIEYAEGILLPTGKRFDSERRAFIKNLDTLDLMAVPGSGKTTVLLAKILILERYLPFDDGAGILILSHTNAAIDEIKNRIGKHCPRIFSYPNFVGTIQSFVDQFLAIPFYVNKFKKRPYRIDNEIYDERAAKYFKEMPSNAAKTYLTNRRRDNPLGLFLSLRLDENMNITEQINGAAFLSSEGNSKSYKQLKNMKLTLLKWGFLHFDDAYFLAKLALVKNPQNISLLRDRFAYIFVDEMQDMEKHQCDLLESLFYVADDFPKFQRIGDLNQAIHSDISSEDCWSARENVMTLNGSHRLTPEIADVVQCMGLEYIDIVGLRESQGVKPYILVYESPEAVLPRFAELIQEKNLTDDEHPFCAIGWTSHGADTEEVQEKIKLQNYHSSFAKDRQKLRMDFPNLKSYLTLHQKTDYSLEPISKNIMNAFIKILRMEGIYDGFDRFYTKTSLLKFLKEQDLEKFEKFKTKIFTWSLQLRKGEDALEDIRNFIPEFIAWFSESETLSQATNDFIADMAIGAVIDELVENGNIYEYNGRKIHVCTVHSVKGQTHTATLYLETYYHRGNGNYESERLAEQIRDKRKIGETLAEARTSKKYISHSAKMAYVGFSRATQLLCFAIHKTRFDALGTTSLDHWHIIEIN